MFTDNNIDLILSHFENPLFPRTMMTRKFNFQFLVYSRQEIIQRCKESDLLDCRINAYPEFVEYKGIVRCPPNFIFIDLDLASFNNKAKKLDSALKTTLNNLGKLEAKPTVLWSGNGYHVYVPLDSIVLDQIDIFSRENFPSLFQPAIGKYRTYFVSELFLKFANKCITNGATDKKHHPKFKSCLIRIPETYNSKCLSTGSGKEQSIVKIIQRWDGKRLPIQLLLKDFRRWIVQEEINQNVIQRKKAKVKEYSFDYSVQQHSRIDWIEKLLQTPIGDQRKYCLWRILVPYLFNIRKLSTDEVIAILSGWLDQCNDITRVNFVYQEIITQNLRYVRNYLPISLNKLRTDNVELYRILEIY